MNKHIVKHSNDSLLVCARCNDSLQRPKSRCNDWLLVATRWGSLQRWQFLVRTSRCNEPFHSVATARCPFGHFWLTMSQRPLLVGVIFGCSVFVATSPFSRTVDIFETETETETETERNLLLTPHKPLSSVGANGRPATHITLFVNVGLQMFLDRTGSQADHFVTGRLMPQSGNPYTLLSMEIVFSCLVEATRMCAGPWFPHHRPHR